MPETRTGSLNGSRDKRSGPCWPLRRSIARARFHATSRTDSQHSSKWPRESTWPRLPLANDLTLKRTAVAAVTEIDGLDDPLVSETDPLVSKTDRPPSDERPNSNEAPPTSESSTGDPGFLEASV